ncbi:hypothetical protein L6164_004735 [Bauhinia variegata]|uniref:Uncharacterized protein n=1 Tax=Bauhinia variegata TaxID=167791 RepID=A0ACB9PN62_BAUVA|nr:hypothetical protein L6164_004735 [Bauhinia variegata]
MRVRQRQTTLVGMLRQVFSPGSSQRGTTTDPTECSLNKGKKITNYKGKKANMSGFKKRKPNASGPRRTSAAWDHFDKLPDSEVSESTAACKYCGKRYLCDPKQHGTSNMLAHLKTCTKYPYAVRHDSSQSVINFTSKKGNVGEDMIVASHKFNSEECRKALASFVIIDEQPFKIVEDHGFISFCAKMQPQFVLPSRYTVARDCYQLYLDEKLRLKSLLKSDFVRVALTIDCWTSIQNLNYLTVTAHFIDNDWRFNKKILCFSLVPNHEGETIGKHIDECLKDWGIRAVFTITVDNASWSDVTISYLKNRIKSMNGLVLDGELLHVHCCVHILNLIVNDGLKDMHDSISSIRNAVRYVRSSPSRLAKFKKCVDFASLPSKCLVCLDVPIGWNSTYLMLEAALRFQAVFEKLKEDDNSYVEYFGVSGPPSALDWLNVKVFLRFVKFFYDATKIFSGSLHITANSAFHQLALILCELKTLCASDDDSLLRTMAIEIKKKYDKYWGNVLNINPMLYFGVIFDPRYKLKYVEWSFDEMYNDDMLTGCDMINRVKSNLSKLFACHKVKLRMRHKDSQLLLTKGFYEMLANFWCIMHFFSKAMMVTMTNILSAHQLQIQIEFPKSFIPCISGVQQKILVGENMSEQRPVHPDCRNSSNPFHECSDYCFRIIAVAKLRMQQNETEVTQASSDDKQAISEKDVDDERPNVEEHSDDDHNHPESVEVDYTALSARQKKWMELRNKMQEAKKRNQIEIANERKRMEAPTESRGITKQKWVEERKKKIGKLLDANGLDMTKAYMLDTQEAAEEKYKKWEKDPAPFGWDVFNQKTLYKAYKKRTKNIDVDLEEYNKMKEADPEFYRDASSLQYGKAPRVSEEKIDRMVQELKDRDEKCKSFSRRRKFHEEKDIDSINDRNEHFNKKIERAFGKYTLEIKNNLERGTALPD